MEGYLKLREESLYSWSLCFLETRLVTNKFIILQGLGGVSCIIPVTLDLGLGWVYLGLIQAICIDHAHRDNSSQTEQICIDHTQR